jgi:rhodanese-related sulfurtransferase
VQAPDENWTLGTGRITPKMIESFMPPPNREDSIVLVCGGGQLIKEVSEVMDQMGYKNYYAFG